MPDDNPEQTYEVTTANGRRWLVTLTPEGGVLKVRREVRARTSASYFRTAHGTGGAAVKAALKLQRGDLLMPKANPPEDIEMASNDTTPHPVPTDPVPTLTTVMVHGWPKANPDEQYYTIVDVADYDSDEVWQSAAKLGPQMYWDHAHRIDDTMSGALKDRVLTRAELDQAAQARLDLFRAERELSDGEAEAAREETGWDREELIGWYKTVEKIFFNAAAHDVLMGMSMNNEGVFSHAESLMEVARLAIARAHEKDWDEDGDALLDPVDHFCLLQDMPEGLRAEARSEYVHAKFAAAAEEAAAEEDDPEEPEQPG
jgi:hypothetical protein